MATSVRYLMPPELVSNPSAILYVRGMVDALYLGKRQLMHILVTGRGFEAAHIFPLAYEGHRIQPENTRGGTINSVQNGLLLRSDIHQLFDSYDLSINPDVCLPRILKV
jgi:hypothetical protein